MCTHKCRPTPSSTLKSSPTLRPSFTEQKIFFIATAARDGQVNLEWAKRKGQEGLLEYRAQKNRFSIDDPPASSKTQMGLSLIGKPGPVQQGSCQFQITLGGADLALPVAALV